MSYTFRIVELHATQVAGMHIETTMQQAMQDCPALWRSFGPRICSELVGHVSLPEKADTFGISKMIDDHRLTYWTAIEVNSTNNLPADMNTMTIPAGLYVTCTAENLEKLSEALTALYMQWPTTTNDYELDMQGICIELYKGAWQINDPIDVYAAIVKKA